MTMLNRGAHQSLMHKWDIPTLQWVVWDGSISTGALTIGVVNQGTGGTSAWKVDGSAVTQPVVQLPSTAVGAAPAVASVGIASAQVIAANTSRKGLALVNLSANNISFGVGANVAVLGSGITLTPNGVWEMDPFSFSTAAINAIAAGAASNLAIQEWT